jgi:hypothetical protein
MGSDETHIYQVESLACHLVLLCLSQGFYVKYTNMDFHLVEGKKI